MIIDTGTCVIFVLYVLALAKDKSMKNNTAQAGKWKGKSTNPVKVKPLKAAHKINNLILFLSSKLLKFLIILKIIKEILPAINKS